MPLLEVNNLKTQFDTENGTVRAVDGIDFSIDEGEVVGLVGESGSGKSVTAESILGLIDSPGKIANGTIRFDGKDLTELSESGMRQLRGGEISMIFQDPMTAFNPTQTVGRQLHDVLRTYETGPPNMISRVLGKDHSEEYRDRVIEAFERVKIPEPASRYSDYPHEFSGGMLQRAMIAMSILCEPQLILADEPTTSLDVTIERQILSLFNDVVEELNTSVLWITHDLSVAATLCDRILVMYAGKMMEMGPISDVLSNPANPYTQSLLDSVPRYDEKEDFRVIEGQVADVINPPDGCRFVERCSKAHDRCHSSHPPMFEQGDQQTACYLAEGDVK